ncbi:MAG: FtsL-like putative cell division protein [Bacteroidota bacterium]
MSDKDTHKNRKSRENNFRKSFRDVFDGSVFTRDIVIRQLPFIIFLALLALIYITNRYHAEKVFVLTEETRKEIRELRSEKITVQSELMRKSRQQEVLKMLEKYGSDLNYAEEPPVKIMYDLDE